MREEETRESFAWVLPFVGDHYHLSAALIDLRYSAVPCLVTLDFKRSHFSVRLKVGIFVLVGMTFRSISPARV